MPDSPHDDELSPAEFHTLLEDMLARVAAAAQEARRSRDDSSAEPVAGASSVEPGAASVQASAAPAKGPVEAAPEPPASALAPAHDEEESSSDVWADTTPFWPMESSDALAPSAGTPSSQDPPSQPAWAWMRAAASADRSSSALPPDAAVPTAGSTGPAQLPAWMRQASLRGLAFAAAVVAIVGLGLPRAMPPATPTASSTSFDSMPPTSAGQTPVATVTAHDATPRAPSLDIAIDADASTESRMLDELARAIGAPGSAAAAAMPARLAIARYDTLPVTGADWQVVATLGTEEVYALVPAGSPLRHLGDLRGRRINVGPDGSARAASGAALYRALFGESPSRSASSALSRDDALRQMLANGEPEALLLFDGQPSTWFAALPASTRHALRLLRLDPGEPAGGRALQRYLPGHLAPGVDDGGTPIPTLREVTFLIAPASTRDAAPVLRALCDHLPTLRLDGHPKWREVDPALNLPTGLQRPGQLAAALTTCAPARPVPSINRRSS